MDSFSFGHILSRKLYYEKFLSLYKQRGVKKWKTHKICQIILFIPMADAAIIIHTDTGEIEEYTNGYKNTTNNRMEIMAVIEAFEHIKKGTSVELHADSKYVLKTIDGQFSRKKNLDLWERLDKACEGLELYLCWVPGHRGHYYNERCDQMCTETMNNTNDLIVDSGYTGKKISTPRTVTGAMSVKIQVPKEFLHSKIEKLDVNIRKNIKSTESAQNGY